MSLVKAQSQNDVAKVKRCCLRFTLKMTLKGLALRLNKYNVTVWLIESESSSLGAMNVPNNELKVGQLKSNMMRQLLD